ncbi:MAG: LytTR family transcriptional regulator DNA-binding domain-containing protein [Bacteroidales bacterium]|nr:LytTR family transcriptional regulator DNA-binding domain-containing protein [Lachnoclostridium sp.]MCM1383280.1 LytTR family transcriptional regulator DNA-binding domain-containing protein [Lachnoclostridium sp.]MCM1465768.1 LytTR family transcriptional regulator DNA-binding domain-containing protein [Bacteroidales bacterium]
MGERKGNFIKIAQQVVECIYQGKRLPLYEGDMVCICPLPYRNSKAGRRSSRPMNPQKGVWSILHGDYRMMYRNERVAVVTGRYCAMRREDALSKEWFYITVILEVLPTGIKIPHIHISNGEEERIYQLRDSLERRFSVHESEILYLEAGHNYVLWHCADSVIEIRGSLKESEREVSGEFVRIHRSFLVNRNHIQKIARCYVLLDNGETLQIPVKKYSEVKKKLMPLHGQ